MNQIPKRTRYDDEIDRIRAVVARHPLPDFVTGFDVQLGEFDGDPALWVYFTMTDASRSSRAMANARADAISALRKAVETDLLDEVLDRYPFFRFALGSERKAALG